jgi:type I restriction enzyme R subunit
VDAYHHFSDPEWDGTPIAEVCSRCGQETCGCETKPPKLCDVCGQKPCGCDKPPRVCPKCGQCPCECPGKVKIQLRDGKEREIQHMVATSFWSADGKPISAEEFLHSLFGALPDFFKSEDELREIWSNPITRKALLEKLYEAGYGADVLGSLQKLINAEKSDLFDVLEYVSFAVKPITRELRVAQAQSKIFSGLDSKHKEFLEFVLSKYIETGVEELDQEKLPDLLNLKYRTISDAEVVLGEVDRIRTTFLNFQKHLYA